MTLTVRSYDDLGSCIYSVAQSPLNWVFGQLAQVYMISSYIYTFLCSFSVSQVPILVFDVVCTDNILLNELKKSVSHLVNKLQITHPKSTFCHVKLSIPSLICTPFFIRMVYRGQIGVITL